MKLFDAHCHLPTPEVLEHAAAAGVAGMAVCADFSKHWENREDVLLALDAGVIGGFSFFRTLENLDLKFPNIGTKKKIPMQLVPNIGIHPWSVSRDWKEKFQCVKACCGGARSFFQTLEKPDLDFSMPGKEAAMLWLGVGETGLDFSSFAEASEDRQEIDKVEQEECFAAHLDLARALNHPVTVHCVQAWGRLVKILRGHPAPKVMFHAYSGSAELVFELINLNCRFSFGDAVMNPEAKRVRAAVVVVPDDRLLIETDSDSEPEKLIEVARAVAELRGVSVEEIAELTFNNAQTLFDRRTNREV